jgi:hypothetical protein
MGSPTRKTLIWDRTRMTLKSTFLAAWLLSWALGEFGHNPGRCACGRLVKDLTPPCGKARTNYDCRSPITRASCRRRS